MEEKIYSKQNVIDVCAAAISVCTEFVNDPDTHEGREARDKVVYPIVMGINLIGNMLAYDINETQAYQILRRFCEGELFEDKDTGVPMRKHVTGDDSNDCEE